jgi:hypothetical protein
MNHGGLPPWGINVKPWHEPLHLVVPPREIEGTTRIHPPKFWEAESVLWPDRSIAWGWLWDNLGDCLKRRPQQERIDVLSDWKKVWSVQKSSIEDVRSYLGKWGAPQEEDGW